MNDHPSAPSERVSTGVLMAFAVLIFAPILTQLVSVLALGVSVDLMLTVAAVCMLSSAAFLVWRLAPVSVTPPKQP